MELAVHSVFSSNSSSNSLTPLFLPTITTTAACSFLPPLLHLRRRLCFSFNFRAPPPLLLQPLHAFSSQSEVQPQSPARWILVPVGDGNWKHIGSEVQMPDAFEIVSDEVTVGRLPDKADIVIPVATVSGVHARIKKQEDRLLIVDLDSTNGTFIDDKRLKPGLVAAVSSGNCITFGDIHLAMFQVSKLKTVEAATKLQEYSEDRISKSATNK